MSRKLLSSMAYQAIKERIAAMPSGSYLSARQCALELGISYTPVREAFLRLQKEGVLRQVPNVGFFIQNVDLTDIFQLFQVRECVELFALDKVFAKLAEKHMDQMRRLCGEQEEARRAGDSYRYTELDAAFHRISLEQLGNRPLLGLYDNTRARYQIISGQLLPLIDEDVQREHREFVQAVERRDLALARQSLQLHIQGMKRRIIDSYVSDRLT
ncbi:MAG: GntR family transcriptional regulator [Oscillospiraceae bacterium]|nr:GntR family transcriptional regulator [Oscillospiraceae bacterium]